MMALSRRSALRAIGSLLGVGAAVAAPASVALATDNSPAVPPDHVAKPMARRDCIEGYIIDRDPNKLIIGATVMFQHANGELAIGTVAEWLDGKNERTAKRRWRVHVDYPELTRRSGHRCVMSVDAIGVVESGPDPRAGWDSAKRVYDHRLAVMGREARS